MQSTNKNPGEQRSPRPKLPSFIQRLLGSELDRRLATGSASALSIRVAGIGALLGCQLLLTRLLGPGVYGDYVYTLSWVNILAVLTVCGMDTAALRFVASYEATGEWSLLRGFVRWSTQIVLAASIGGAMAFATWLLLFGDGSSTELRSALLVAALLVPATAMLLLLGALLRGLKQVAWAMAPPFILRPLLLALGVLLVVELFPHTPTAAQVIAIEFGVMLLLILWMIHTLRRKAPTELASEPIGTATRLWLVSALPLLLITGVRVGMSKVDILVLGLHDGTRSAGIYAVAGQLALLIGLGLFAVNMIVAPMIAQLHAQKRFADLQRIIRRGAQATLGFATIGGLLLFLLGKPLLGLFGPAFSSGYPALRVLVVGQVLNSLAGSVGFLMTMTAQEREAALVSVSAVALDLLLLFLLIPRFGQLGAAYATVAAGAAWNLTLVILVWRRLGINSTALPTPTH